MWVNLRMSFLDQMKLPGLIDLSLILILASTSKGQGWNIQVKRSIKATLGSNVNIQCTFEYPLKDHSDFVQVYWKKPVRSTFNTFDKDTNAYVFHPNDSFVLEKYRGKTKLTGDTAQRNCSLEIRNITENEQNIYVRVIAKDNFSFKAEFVSISVSGPGVIPVSLKPDISRLTQPLPTYETTTMGSTQKPSSQMYTAIFVPVAALLIIIFVVGIVFFIKHKRSQSFTREESGYYANFSRASSNQAKREVTCKKQENKKLPELKAFDEPVYMNTEAPPGQMAEPVDHTDNIYANVDYSE